MTHCAYLFEAKSIQAWLTASGRLRDLVGASELVDSLCGDLLNDCLAALDIPKGVVTFSRQAGGAFYAYSEHPDALQRLHQLWPLVVQQYAPGLSFDHGLGTGASPLDADADAREALSRNRSQVRPSLPQAGPRVQTSPRTGRPAIGVRTFPDGVEFLDAATARQRRFARPDRMGLIERLSPPVPGLTWKHWPLDLSPDDARRADDDPDDTPAPRLMPFLGESRVIGVLHADGNGMGELLTGLRKHLAPRPQEDFIAVFKALSEGLSKATREAAQAAVDRVLIPRRVPEDTGLLPARPVVLGGDDLTMILRADVALPFARVFLDEFAQRTPAVMAKVRGMAQADEKTVPHGLTACAGIAWIKASQPFALAAELAEGITAAVKQAAKAINPSQPPSSLAFHRVTTAMIDDYDAVLKRELSTWEGGTRWCHSLGAYGLDADGKLPALDDLLALQRLLSREDMARGPARQVLTLLADSPAQAQVRWRRWRTLMADRKEVRDMLDTHLGRLLANTWSVTDLPYSPIGEHERAGPLGDLHALIAVGNDPDLPAASEEPRP